MQQFEYYSSMDRMQVGTQEYAHRGWRVHSFAVEHELRQEDGSYDVSHGYMVLFEQIPKETSR